MYDPTGPPPEFRFEVVAGRIVRKPMGFAEMRWASILHELLAPQVRASGVGECYVDGGFTHPRRAEPQAGRVRSAVRAVAPW